MDFAASHAVILEMLDYVWDDVVHAVVDGFYEVWDQPVRRVSWGWENT